MNPDQACSSVGCSLSLDQVSRTVGLIVGKLAQFLAFPAALKSKWCCIHGRVYSPLWFESLLKNMQP